MSGHSIGARLRGAARARGLTNGQVYLNVNAGREKQVVSSATISALFRGAVAKPSVHTVKLLAESLGLTLEEALGGVPMPDVPEPLPDDDEVLLKLTKEVLALRKDVDELKAAASKPPDRTAKRSKAATAPPRRKNE